MALGFGTDARRSEVSDTADQYGAIPVKSDELAALKARPLAGLNLPGVAPRPGGGGGGGGAFGRAAGAAAASNGPHASDVWFHASSSPQEAIALLTTVQTLRASRTLCQRPFARRASTRTAPFCLWPDAPTS